MANVGFKLGPQQALDDLIKLGTSANAAPGSFYLTSDTHRLYIGCDDKSIAPVNEGIITVKTLGDLPNVSANPTAYAGRFYYVTGDTNAPLNILCIFNGSSWVQLNPDTSVGKVNWNVVEFKEDHVRVNNVVWNLTNGGSTPVNGDYLEFAGAKGIDVKYAKVDKVNGVECHRITLTGDQYAVSAAANGSNVDLKLTSDQGKNSTVQFTTGNWNNTDKESNVSVGVSDGKIVIKAKDTKVSSLQVSNNNGANGNTGFNIMANHNYGGTVSVKFDPKIKVGKDQQTVSFSSGEAVLDVPTNSDIEDLMKRLNAMTYRGTVGGNPKGSVATNITYNTSTKVISMTYDGTKVTASIGDMFMVCSTGISVDGSTYLEIGSLLIAKGTEDSSGIITDATLAFDVVKATKDTDSTYYFKALSSVPTNGGGIRIVNQTGAESGALSIKGKAVNSNGTEAAIVVERALTNLANGGVQEALTLSHGNVKQTKSGTKIHMKDVAISTNNAHNTTGFSREIEIPIVTAITTNDQGHVTSVTTNTYTLQDTSGKTTGAFETSIYSNGNKNVGIVKSVLTTTAPSGAHIVDTKYFGVSSESLSIATDTNKNVNGGPDDAPSLKIDLVWGSFS